MLVYYAGDPGFNTGLRKKQNKQKQKVMLFVLVPSPSSSVLLLFKSHINLLPTEHKAVSVFSSDCSYEDSLDRAKVVMMGKTL